MTLIEHQRKFLPVGHGAFFVERLYVNEQRVLSAVYDCGDSDKGTIVHSYITQEFGADKESKEMIDLLFLSHFDSDHVNGLEYLQPYLSSKTRVFLPFYYTHMQSIYDRNKREGIEYVISILGQSNIKPILVQYGENYDQRPDIDIDEYDYERNGGMIWSGQFITKKVQGQPIWRYIPFNLFNEQSLYQDFLNKVTNGLGWNIAKLQDAAQWTLKDRKDLRRIYRSFTKTNINDNSLMVLSDKAYRLDWCDTWIVSAEYQSQMKNQCWCDYCCCCPSCLYTGDTVLKRGARKSKYINRYEDFLKELKKYTDNVSLMQIPHHGSSNNTNIATLSDCMSGRLFCNYGTQDTSNKTFILTQKVLETVWKNIAKVTDLGSSVYEEHNRFFI